MRMKVNCSSTITVHLTCTYRCVHDDGWRVCVEWMFGIHGGGVFRRKLNRKLHPCTSFTKKVALKKPRRSHHLRPIWDLTHRNQPLVTTEQANCNVEIK
jgi:hypothetical protein